MNKADYQLLSDALAELNYSHPRKSASVKRQGKTIYRIKRRLAKRRTILMRIIGRY
jgi:hypothetical protein